MGRIYVVDNIYHGRVRDFDSATDFLLQIRERFSGQVSGKDVSVTTQTLLNMTHNLTKRCPLDDRMEPHYFAEVT